METQRPVPAPSDRSPGPIHALLGFTRDDEAERVRLRVDPQYTGTEVPGTVLGMFLEHLSYSTVGGVSAELLVNRTFHRQHHLAEHQLRELVRNGEALVDLHLSGGDPRALAGRWRSTPHATGFGVAVLDDATGQGLPLGWTPIGYPHAASASVGRIGGAIRLRGGRWSDDPDHRWTGLDDGPAGIRQGIFLPVQRCRGYIARFWVRIAGLDPDAAGEIEVALRRRVATPDGTRQAGEILASERVTTHGTEWRTHDVELTVDDGAVMPGEPVDLSLRWMPRSRDDLHLLVDRASLLPNDHLEGLDPDVVAIVRELAVPRLRWPGGNFVSHYRWRDGVGPPELRPTDVNRAWGGIEDHLIGTDEFLTFCRLTGAEPHITVNSGTAPPEEAAAWVEYCNGEIDTRMGALRALNGHREPYDVVVWEVGNENFGAWQGGHVGSDENARRFSAFATVMRSASRIPIELMACGNNFDFARPGPDYDHVTADRRWHDQLLAAAPDDIDYLSLHPLPANHHLLDDVSAAEAHEAVLAQVTTWERTFLPELLRRCDASGRDPQLPPIRLAMTEWGPLGRRHDRLHVENFGAVVYAGAFLGFMVRNSERVPVASPNGFMHGGAIRKAAGRVFIDPQVQAMQLYRPFVGGMPLRCEIDGPGYDVVAHADLGAPDCDIPYVDAAACRSADDPGLTLVGVTNRHLHDAIWLDVEVPDLDQDDQPEVRLLAHPDIAARATPAEPDRFPVEVRHLEVTDGVIGLRLPSSSLAVIRLRTRRT